ncbi:MAG: Ig-like domain-containing protein [Sulfolobales archaeon]|nr:Ig-like domain-containing protein [Sulfolobales archaeon]
MRIPASALLILLLVVIPAISLAIVSASIGGITILSPTQGQSFSAGQPLVLVVNATGYAGQVATVYVYNPGDSIVYSNTFQVPSNGILNATLFNWPATTSGKFPAGTYTIVVLIGSAAAASVQVYWAPGIANIVVTVVNGQTGLPLPNAPVSVYNASSNTLLASGITNSSGMVTLHVVAVPNVSETLKIIATPQGYPPQGVLYTIKGPGTYAITLKVYPTSLSLNVLGAYIGTVQVAPAQPSSVTASEGEPLSLIVQATYEGSPASNATVSATMQIGGTNVTGTVVPVGNGVFNVTFMVPSVGVPLSGYIVVTASYKGSTAQLNVPVVAQVNYGTYLNNISSSVAQVNKTVAALQEELSAFNTTVTSVQKQLQSLSTQLSSLNSSIASLSSKLNQLSSQVSSLSSQLSSSQNMIYAGLIVGIIALIIAIVALVMVLRKIS